MRGWLPVPIVLLSTGCLILPTAPYRLTSDSRRLVADERVRSLEPGSATRIDVLLSLGAPEVLLDGERLILYQWSTQSGLIVVGNSGGSLNAHNYDLLFEFDDDGLLLRSGDLKTLLAEGFGRDRPLDVSTPIEIPIWRVGWSQPPGRLVLERTALRFEKSGEPPRSFTIPPGGALIFDYRTDREAGSFQDWRRYDLRFRDASGQVEELGFDIDVRSLLVLARYLHEHSPGIEIRE